MNRTFFEFRISHAWSEFSQRRQNFLLVSITCCLRRIWNDPSGVSCETWANVATAKAMMIDHESILLEIFAVCVRIDEKSDGLCNCEWLLYPSLRSRVSNAWLKKYNPMKHNEIPGSMHWIGFESIHPTFLFFFSYRTMDLSLILVDDGMFGGMHEASRPWRPSFLLNELVS